MAGYRTILVGLDLADESRRAVERAAGLARLFDARIYLAHVIEHFPEDLPLDMVPGEDSDPGRVLADRAHEKAATLAREAGIGNARIIVEATPRSAKRHLLQLAASLKPDLIVVGGAGEAGLGSTASGIVHRAPCDVLVVHA